MPKQKTREEGRPKRDYYITISYIDPDERSKFLDYCYSNNINISAFIRTAIQNELKRVLKR
jgi:hypothetical protein